MSDTPNITASIQADGATNLYGTEDYKASDETLDYVSRYEHIIMTHLYTFEGTTKIDGKVTFK